MNDRVFSESLRPTDRRLPFDVGAKSGNPAMIGQILKLHGRISEEGVQRVLDEQRSCGMPFGMVATRLRLVGEPDVRRALSFQFDHSQLPVDPTAASDDVVTARDPGSASSIALRAIRGQLLISWKRRPTPPVSVSVLSVDEGEGRTFVAANLAVLFAQMGRSTLLIDGNFERPKLHDLFRVPRRRGLEGLLSGRADIGEVMQLQAFPKLSLLPAIGGAANSMELLSGERFGRLIQEFSRFHDIVIVDTPPARRSAVPQLLASICDSTIVVSRKGKTDLMALRRLAESLRCAGVDIAGSVINER